MDKQILVVEGEKKTACAAKDGFRVFGVGGVDCWQQGGEPLPDLDLFEWQGNGVFLFFDSDSKDNPNVERALIKLARELKKRGATVFRANPPSGPGGEKWGYDDCRKHLGKKKTLALVADAEEVELPPDKIEDLNKRYYVALEGNVVRIHDEVTGAIITQQDFRLRYLNQYVEDAEGNLKSLGDQWLKSRHRRGYDQMTFNPDPNAPDDPNVYNRFKGLPLEAIPGDWSLLREHILGNICSGNKAHNEYLVNLLARGVQEPHRPAEIAVVLRGEQGTGKGVFVSAYMKLFGDYVHHASSSKEITGFNGHFLDTLVVFADEAFFAGDKSHLGILKALITERFITIEDKYKTAVNVLNMFKLFMASNESWVIPAGKLERRFLVLDVSPAQQQNTKYFGAIMTQLECGGYEAFYYDLLHRDLSKFNHRDCPRTDALAEQQLYSMTPVELYWYSILDEGLLPGAKRKSKGIYLPADWGLVEKQILHADFIKQARERGVSHLPDKSQFGKQLKPLLPSGYPKSTRLTINGNRRNCWELPPLKTCKRTFDAVRGARGVRGIYRTV